MEFETMATIRTLLASALLMLLGACASAPYAQRTSERQAAYAAAAGAPVRNFRFFSLYSWEPLSDRQVAIYTRPNQAWLLDLGGACPDISFVNTIGLTSNLNQVMVGFDRVLTGRNDFPCTISQIRPVDVKSLKATQLQQRRIRSASRSADKPDATR
jgi:uncharacterized lipoprotein YajG